MVDWRIVAPWLVTAVTALVGVLQFLEQRRQNARKPFLEQQLAICISAVDAVATMASTTDRGAFERCRLEFWQLYFGRLALVEDRKVEAAMVRIGRLVPSEPTGDLALPHRPLQGPALILANEARNLILASWGVNLPSLDRRPPMS